MERFYQRGTETAIRVEALNQLENLVLLHSVTYEVLTCACLPYSG